MQRLVEKTRCSLDKKWVRASLPIKEAAVATSRCRRPGRPGDNRPVFEIEHWGWIFIDKNSERFEAVCSCMGEDLTPYKVHAPWCKVRDHRWDSAGKLVPCKKWVVASKFPLGLLVAWLRDGHLWESHEKHLTGAGLITREERIEARAWLQAQPDMAALLKQEIDWDVNRVVGYDAAGNIEEPATVS